MDGLPAALRRAQAYRDAGADVIFVETPCSDEDLRAIPEALPNVPLLINIVEGGRTPERGCGRARKPRLPTRVAGQRAPSRTCLVAGCDYDCFRDPLCFQHYSKRDRDAPTSDVAQWVQSQTPFLHAQHFSWVPFEPLVRLEVLHALQERDRRNLVLNPPLVGELAQRGSVSDFTGSDLVVVGPRAR